jgi:hypothetical protein
MWLNSRFCTISSVTGFTSNADLIHTNVSLPNLIEIPGGICSVTSFPSKCTVI